MTAHVRTEVEPDAAAAARTAAAAVAAALERALDERGRATLALSRVEPPATFLRLLLGHDVRWDRVHVFQADERVAPDGSPDRNIGVIASALHGVIDAPRLHPMPVTEADLEQAAACYATELRAHAGDPAVLDAVHLGLGTDAHTASLLPGDPVQRVTDRDVALTGAHDGFRRMTLTVPALRRARSLVFLATGSSKAVAVARVLAGDTSAPATAVAGANSLLVTDAAAHAAAG